MIFLCRFFRIDFIAIKYTANIVHDYGTIKKYETTFAFIAERINLYQKKSQVAANRDRNIIPWNEDLRVPGGDVWRARVD